MEVLIDSMNKKKPHDDVELTRKIRIYGAFLLYGSCPFWFTFLCSKIWRRKKEEENLAFFGYLTTQTEVYTLLVSNISPCFQESTKKKKVKYFILKLIFGLKFWWERNDFELIALGDSITKECIQKWVKLVKNRWEK